MSARNMVFFVALIALAAVGCAERGQSGNQSLAGIEEYTFESFGEMVATSDAVVVGVVASETQGTVLGDPSGPEHFEFMALELRTDQVLRGGMDPRDPVIVEDEPLSEYDVEWREPGTRVLIFLKEKSNGRYRLVNSQSVFAVEGDDLSVATSDQFTSAVAERSLSSVTRDVREASAAADRGEIAPQEPWPADRTYRPDEGGVPS